MKKLTGIVAAAAALALASVSAPAAAEITITTCQQCQNGTNVLFQMADATLDGTVFGSVKQGDQNFLVKFTSLTGQNLVTPAKGQARIEADGALLNSLMITLDDPSLTFDFIEFKLSGQPDGMLTLIGIDQNGMDFSETFNLSNLNGADFFSATTDQFQTIKSISFSGDVGFDDIRQIRLGSITSTIPEPATWGMMLLGFALSGSAIRRRRRTVLQRVFA